MKVKTFNIPIYNYRVILAEIESKEDINDIPKILRRVKAKKKHINEEINNIKNGRYNGAMTYTNFSLRTFLILLYKTTSIRRRFEILGHEKRHIEDRIAEHCRLKDIEAMGYVAGFLTEKLFI
jgi:hypothetical protein